MKIILSAISPHKTRTGTHTDALFTEYVQRIARYTPTEVRRFLTEAAMFTWMDEQSGRARPHLVLLDTRGKQLPSEELAGLVGRIRDSGTQSLILAVGPADGWTDTARSRAGALLSFGPITLPHELARIVLAEQIYRALTILAGHPYHSGH